MCLLCFGVFRDTACNTKSIDANIPNPSDWIAWVYSPVADVFKSMLK